MGRRLRCLLAGRLVEVTSRAVQGRFLLCLSSEVNQAIKGTLGRAQRYYGLRVVACVFLSNHFHLLVLPDSEKQLADFMRFVKTNLSKQLGRIHGWSGPMLKRRYQAIPVSDEEEAQVDRLRYILEHGVKEGLVGCPADWPGVQCVLKLTQGPSQLYGIWHERTAIWEAEQRGEELPKKERISRETMDLSPLPVWETRSAAKRDGAIREMVAEIEARGRELRGGSAPLGVRAILRQDPHSRPRSSKRSPAPIAHAATVEVWLAMKIAHQEVVAVYRRAAEQWKRDPSTTFPSGCFPPSAPFVARAGPVWA